MKSMQTILIADDDQDVRTIVKMVLESAHYQIIEADNGRTVLEIAKRSRPDLLVLDLTMPGVTGMEVLQALKNDCEMSNIPIVLMSANDEVLEHADTYLGGMHACLLKPMAASDLLATVQRLLA